jgi:hypothetical protein
MLLVLVTLGHETSYYTNTKQAEYCCWHPKIKPYPSFDFKHKRSPRTRNYFPYRKVDCLGSKKYRCDCKSTPRSRLRVD